MKELVELLKHGYVLFRLKKPLTAKSKVPAAAGWQSGPGVREKELKKGDPYGVRLGDRDLVLDFDPRNYAKGLDPRLALMAERRWAEFPCVDTPSGGYHYYMRLPPGVGPKGLKGKLVSDAYSGVDIKKEGGYVVAPGSVRDDGARYEFALSSGSFPAPLVPPVILNLLMGSGVMASSELGHDDKETLSSADELRAYLYQRKPVEYRTRAAWVELMAAVHGTCLGATWARSVFLEWSLQDPFADTEAEVERVWASFKVGRPGGAGLGALRKAVVDGGGSLRFEADRDFAGLLSADGLDTEAVARDGVLKAPAGPLIAAKDEPGVLEKLSQSNFLVDDGSALMIWSLRYNSELGVKLWVPSKKRDFLDRTLADTCGAMIPSKVLRAGKKKKLVSVGEFWVNEAGAEVRPVYTGIVFAPGRMGAVEPRTAGGELNTWTGLGIEARQGADWSLFKELIDDLSEGHSWWVRRWLADLVQNPGEPSRVAIALHGGKGVGKTIFGERICRLFGAHGMVVHSPKQLTGDFNYHLRTKVVVFADEAIWAGDKPRESALKKLISDRIMSYEAKYRQAESGKNYVHLIMASNEEWFVPASDDERRFAVFRARDKVRSPAFWAALIRQMDQDGGLEGMLWDLLEEDLELAGFNIADVPKTQAMREQKSMSLSPFRQWFYALVESDYANLEIKKGVYLIEDLHSNLQDFWADSKFHGHVPSRDSMGRELKRILSTDLHKKQVVVEEGRKPWGYALPKGKEAYEIMRKKFGGESS